MTTTLSLSFHVILAPLSGGFSTRPLSGLPAVMYSHASVRNIHNHAQKSFRLCNEHCSSHAHIRLHVGCFQIVLAAFIWIMVGNIVLLGTVGFFVRWLSDDDDEYLLG